MTAVVQLDDGNARIIYKPDRGWLLAEENEEFNG